MRVYSLGVVVRELLAGHLVFCVGTKTYSMVYLPFRHSSAVFLLLLVFFCFLKPATPPRLPPPPLTSDGPTDPQARQHAGSLNSTRHSSAAGGGGGSSSNRPTGSTWGDVLMHVVSLPSSSSSTQPRKAKAKASGAQGSGANGAGEAWGPATSEDLLRAERRRAVALGGSGVIVNGVLPPRVGRSMSRRADGAGAVSGNAAREEVGGGEGVQGGLRRRRSFSGE